MNRSCVFEVIPLRLDESVAQALVIAFLVIMRDEILNSCPQRTFTEQDERFLLFANGLGSASDLMEQVPRARRFASELTLAGHELVRMQAHPISGHTTFVIRHAQACEPRSIDSFDCISEA